MHFHALIIDDDHDFKKILEMRLASFIPDMVVTSFDNLEKSRAFLNEVKNVTFDLVIVDEHLPDGSGHDLIAEGWFNDLSVLAVSSDDAPEIPGAAIQAGAMYFLQKRNISERLFRPLVLGIIDRNRIQRQLTQAKVDSGMIEAVKILASTLRHEINNPLGAVLGAAYVLGRSEAATPEQREAAKLVESSGKRIRDVLEKLCQASELKPVSKASHKVYHIPGDKPWEEGTSNYDQKDSSKKDKASS